MKIVVSLYLTVEENVNTKTLVEVLEERAMNVEGVQLTNGVFVNQIEPDGDDD